jgi:DNA polymerase elongation subunit (family B)
MRIVAVYDSQMDLANATKASKVVPEGVDLEHVVVRMGIQSQAETSIEMDRVEKALVGCQLVLLRGPFSASLLYFGNTGKQGQLPLSVGRYIPLRVGVYGVLYPNITANAADEAIVRVTIKKALAVAPMPDGEQWKYTFPGYSYNDISAIGSVVPRSIWKPSDTVDFQMFDIKYDRRRNVFNMYGRTLDSLSVHVETSPPANLFNFFVKPFGQYTASKLIKKGGKRVQRRDLRGYRPDPIEAYEFSCKSAYEMTTLLKDFEGALTYDGRISPMFKFCMATGISTHGWVRVSGLKPCGLATTDIDVVALRVGSIETSDNAPCRLMAFDIETLFRRPGVTELDPVIMISASVEDANSAGLTIDKKGVPSQWSNVVFVLGGAHVDNAIVFNFDSETLLLRAWWKFVEAVDPDCYIGHNVKKFDMTYLITRSCLLGLTPNFSRVKGLDSKFHEKKFESRAFGQNVYMEIDMDGRFSIDTLIMARRTYKLNSYNLDTVCKQTLGDGKLDVSYDDIPRFFLSDRDTLAKYCLVDSQLTLRLVNHQNKYNEAAEFSKLVSAVGADGMWTSGVGQKVLACLLRFNMKDKEHFDYIMPDTVTQFVKKIVHSDTDEGEFVLPETEGRYEGAYVMPPKVGLHQDAWIFDFASLYPSIMIAYNLSPDTLLTEDMLPRLGLTRDDCHVFAVDARFMTVKATVKKGILPWILEYLKQRRDQIKAAMKKVASGGVEYKVLDGQQNAVKIIMNSVYGVLGASFGQMSMKIIAREVCKRGQQALEIAKNAFLEYTGDKGNVLYGDTDSLFVQYAGITEALKTAPDKKACIDGHVKAILTHINSKFSAPMSMAFEKHLDCIVLFKKKRYAGLYDGPKGLEIYVKGLDIVRRDRCEYARNLQQSVMDTLLKSSGTLNDRLLAVKNIVVPASMQLLRGEVPAEALMLSTQISKSHYDGSPRHWVLYQRMLARQDPNTPAIGDRLSYVLIQGVKNTKNSELVETLEHVQKNKDQIRVDYAHYFQVQVRKPIVTLFQDLMPNCDKVIFGEPDSYTRKHVIKAPITRDTPLVKMGFTVVQNNKRRKTDPVNVPDLDDSLYTLTGLGK